MNKNVKKIVMASLMAALCCVATMIIKIPTPLKGYLNLGDAIVLLSGWLLSPGYGFLAAGIGSALADVFSGYMVYAPATFVIKGVMALVTYYCFKYKKDGRLPRLISGSLAEFVMVFGYFIFESCLYGVVPSLANIPANAIQGVAGLLIGIRIMKIFEKKGVLNMTKSYDEKN